MTPDIPGDAAQSGDAPSTHAATTSPSGGVQSDAQTAPEAGATPLTTFADLGLPEPIVQAVAAIGYESASPIQAATIPVLLEGVDVLGQAQTGTGKTAAFALPILARLDLDRREPQALVLVPTRELAIQVSEAFRKYATALPGFHVLPIYGGQSYIPQLNALKRGPHVIVGTPGRIIDHLDRSTLDLQGIGCVVLDEADEMLAMGFADALETILAQTPADKQVALFSATMAPNIRRIAREHLRNPREVLIRERTTTAARIQQSYWIVSGMHKLDALTRIVEVAEFDAMIVFVRTKQSTVDLADRLQARGLAATAINGDIQQAVRERTIAQLKSGSIDILVATDVAARGLDVDRITHVVNYDVPYDTEAYVHRIGRTGRAGRSGEAILFVAPRERRMLKAIERATGQSISPLRLPSVDDVNTRRLARFKARIGEAIVAGPNEFFRRAIQEVSLETGADLLTVASAVASMLEGATAHVQAQAGAFAGEAGSGAHPVQANPHQRAGAARGRDAPDGDLSPLEALRERLPDLADEAYQFQDDGQQTQWRMAVGHRHGVQAGNIVGAIAHEAHLEGAQINGVEIRADYSLVRLPARLPHAVIERLSQVRVRGHALDLQEEAGNTRERAPRSGARARAPENPYVREPRGTAPARKPAGKAAGKSAGKGVPAKPVWKGLKSRTAGGDRAPARKTAGARPAAAAGRHGK